MYLCWIWNLYALDTPSGRHWAALAQFLDQILYP